ARRACSSSSQGKLSGSVFADGSGSLCASIFFASQHTSSRNFMTCSSRQSTECRVYDERARHTSTIRVATRPCARWHTRPMPASMTAILDARGATRVRFSPDGAWLGFVTDRSGTPQLWRIPTAGGEPQRLTDHDRVGAYRFAPDGRRIAYGADVGGNERWQIWVMDADGRNARKLTERDDRIHHLRGWTTDGRSLLVHTNERDPKFFDLVAYDAATGTARTLHQFDGTVSDATPLDDGSVVVTTNRARGDENHLILLTPDGASRVLTPDEPPALYDVVAAVPGGLVVRSDRGRDFVGLAAIRT